MESLVENKPLLWSVFSSIIAVIVLVTGVAPELCEQFSIVPFPNDVSIDAFICTLFRLLHLEPVITF